jgi:beta-lactamase superfamily II metal-dependent hydrolase
VVPYLQSIGHPPSAGFDYTIAGHQHCDHVGSMDEVINAGYDVRVRNYDNGSNSSSCVTQWNRGRHHHRRSALRAQPGDGSARQRRHSTVLASLGDIIGGGAWRPPTRTTSRSRC